MHISILNNHCNFNFFKKYIYFLNVHFNLIWIYTTVQTFGTGKMIGKFLKVVSYAQKYTTNTNIVKYYYNLKWLFYVKHFFKLFWWKQSSKELIHLN